MFSKRTFLALLAAMLLAAASITPALAADEHRKCNSGNGNGQETTIENDCDPGNSGGHNNGGG
jgi:uncharacterized membrane protein